MISSSIIPIALTMLKFMLIKSAFIGKMAIILLIANMFLRFNRGGGVYSHNISLSPPEKDVAMLHYGYNGNEEYGAYIHRRKRRWLLANMFYLFLFITIRLCTVLNKYKFVGWLTKALCMYVYLKIKDVNNKISFIEVIL